MLKPSENFCDPYPFYTHIRNHTPIYQDEQATWHLTRYQDVVVLLSDPRFRRQSPISFSYINQNNAESMADILISKWSLFSDPPMHTHYREMLSVLFNPQSIKDTKLMIQSIVDSNLSALLKHSRVDFMQAFAYKIPIDVINQLLGTSLDIAVIRKWSQAVATALDHGTLEDFSAITPDIISMQEYFHELVIQRETHPQQDWISELVKLKKPFQLSTEDIISNCIFILLAAHETLQLSIGLGLLTLLKHPQQYLMLKNQPELIPGAIEEMLRYDAPWNKMCRWSYEDVAFGDVIIPKHQLVTGLINSANRDPDRFTNPDQFDITRTNNRHLAFGTGIHACHGSLLARLELQAAFSALVPFLHRFTLEENQIKWLPNSSLRYISSLVVEINE